MMVTAFLALTVLCPDVEHALVFERAARQKRSVIICSGVPVPEGNWAALYRPRSRFGIISVHQWDEKKGRHTFVGWAETRNEVRSLLLECSP